MYDYIIVGAGTAGCVLAYRLSADPACRVLLVEAGPADRHPFIHMPKGMAKLFARPEYVWPFEARFHRGSNAAPQSWLRGKMLGGSSSINGMMYVRGHARDFDDFAAQTSDDWSWVHISKAYEELENHELGAAPGRGGAGPLRITMPDLHSSLTGAMVQAGSALGLGVVEDVNCAESAERVGYAPRIIHHGRRQSAATAFLRRALRRHNLTVVTDTMVDRVIVQGRKATGVLCVGRDGAKQYDGGVIVLSGGTLQSPAILQRSGIGPVSLLKHLGIEAVADSPEVGENLQEHRALVFQWRLRDGPSQNQEFGGWRLLRNTVQYYLTGSGPMSAAAYEIGLWLKTRHGLDHVNGQFLVAPFSMDFGSKVLAMEPWPGMNMCTYILRPRSKGQVWISSADSAKLPEIYLDFFADAEDRREMIELFHLARQYAASPPLSKYVEAETSPGPSVRSDEEILDAYARLGMCGYHAVGTCRMGKDDRAVVAPDLHVRGVENLCVADLSIAPFIPAGNTFAPTAALAWRAADILQGGTA
jgi:choline dehydrogenase-like flavoprotein